MNHSARLEINYNVVESLETFFQGWLIRQEEYLQELVQEIECGTSNNEENELRYKELITKVLAHYAEYYAAKARVAQQNVFLLFSATWLSSYERIYLWIGGFRPGLVFRLLSSSVSYLTEDQSRRIRSLIAQTQEEENELDDRLAAVQDSVVSSQMVALAQMGRLKNGTVPDMEYGIERLRISMEVVVESADYLRKKTVAKILEILSSSQALRFLAAVAQFQLTIRSYGLRRDANGPRSNDVH